MDFAFLDGVMSVIHDMEENLDNISYLENSRTEGKEQRHKY